MTAPDQPLAVGLVGAGPWANMVHAPVLAAGPETRLAGVWSRTPAHAAALAGQYQAPAFARYEQLLDACEAVAFAVAPTVQPELATAAARAGKAVLLEKPLGLDTAGAQRIADAVGEAGVASVVVLSYRFSPPVRAWLDEARTFAAMGGRGSFVSGAFLGDSPFTTPWRMEHGCLLDIGPHIVDLLDAALGPVTAVRATGDPQRLVALALEHDGGAAASSAILSARSGIPSQTDIEVYGEAGRLALDARAVTGPEAFAVLRREFAGAARRGGGHPVDAAHGLRLQRIIDDAAAQLRRD